MGPEHSSVTPVQRLAGWLYTGPLGHLYGGVADWLGLFTDYARSRAQKRREADH
jgi:hypothetical protein